jgi:hypothetical protein
VIEAIAALDPKETTDPDTVAERSMLKILSKFNKIKRAALRRSFINVARKMIGKDESPDAEE